MLVPLRQSTLTESKLYLYNESKRKKSKLAAGASFAISQPNQSNKITKESFESDFPAILEKMEKAVLITSERDGYAVEEKDSYADVTIFSLLRDIHC